MSKSKQYPEVVEALREEYPKACKASVSMALHTNDYGVRFCARAQEIYDTITQQKPRSAKRKKACRFQCRLTESAAESVKQAMERHGIASVQTLLEMLLIAWAQKESAAGWEESGSAPKRNNNGMDYTASKGGCQDERCAVS